MKPTPCSRPVTGPSLDLRDPSGMEIQGLTHPEDVTLLVTLARVYGVALSSIQDTKH